MTLLYDQLVIELGNPIEEPDTEDTLLENPIYKELIEDGTVQ